MLLKERVNLIKDYFQYQEEDNKIFDLTDTNKEYCLGRIMIGENNLLYHKFIKSSPEYEKIPVIISNIVNHIIFESLTHGYQTHIIRFREFQKDGYLEKKYWDKRRLLTQYDKKETRRRNYLGDSWYEKLKNILDHEHMMKLGNIIKQIRSQKLVFPSEDRVFRAYKLSSFEHTKVVILGQDPYYTKNNADGLAFSFLNGLPQGNQKALDVIFKEIEKDCYDGFCLNKNYQLDYLAKQGVLLLNTSLTVEYNKPKSHATIGWDRFIKYTIKLLLERNEPLVIVTMGTVAKDLFESIKFNISNVNFLYFHTKHPSADLYKYNAIGQIIEDYPNTFSGCRIFSKINKYLIDNNKKAIQWMDQSL